MSDELHADYERFPWPDDLTTADEVERLASILMDYYAHTFDRSEGAIEKAARILWERAGHLDWSEA